MLTNKRQSKIENTVAISALSQQGIESGLLVALASFAAGVFYFYFYFYFYFPIVRRMLIFSAQ
ncbi:MAG: hypothetical protein AAF629_32485 [Chloroflexota bacterium]